MTNGYRRGGQYRTRNGGTAWRRGTRISPARTYQQWGMTGTGWAGLGAALTMFEVTLQVAWRSLGAAWRGGKKVHLMMNASSGTKSPALTPGKPPAAKRPARPAPDPAANPLLFVLEADQRNGWRKGDVQCKVHHSQRITNCKGCAAAQRAQRQVNAARAAQ